MCNVEETTENLERQMLQSRNHLKTAKPKVYEKLMKHLENEENGIKSLFLVDLVYNFACNFRCSHCCAEAFAKQSREECMSLEDVKRIADMADEAGVVVISLIGGEPLVWKNIKEIVEMIDPSRFLINITTNGSLLDFEMAKFLKEIGISKVNISIDSFIEKEHDMFRNHEGSYNLAMKAIENLEKVGGINIQISTVATHQNVYEEGFEKMLEFSSKKSIQLDVKVATPTGNWLGNKEACITKKDAENIKKLSVKYPLLRRDLYGTPGKAGGDARR